MRSPLKLWLCLALVVAVVAGCSAAKDPVVPQGDSAAAPEPAAASGPQAAEPPAEAPAVAASPVAGYLEDPAALTRGRGLFRSVCAGYCHSTQARDRVASFLFDCTWDYGSSDEEIFHVIAAGIPDTQMQGFGGKVQDEDLWKIIAWVRSASTCSSDGA